MVRNSNDETNFLHNLILANTQVSSIRKALANNSSTYIKFSKTQLTKMIKLGGFLPLPLMFLLLTLQRPGFFEGRKAGGGAASAHHLPFLYF